MRPDKRYGAFLILSIVFLAVFLFSPSRHSIRGNSASDRPAPVSTSSSLPVFPVDINAAGAEELMLLPGVGEKTAQSIIEKRKELGGFRSIDELAEVRWIGKARLARIRKLVTINGGRLNEEADSSEGGPH